ncbi:energy-coupling factor transporter transmembrane component T [Paenibacillus sp. sgz500958]|uniref:energy-coupling factor transporter transmembrane component T n=1 Tax=Paenibacillus sp. sgz500958 TaxID=3242475 RepID=UPI0036D27B36
MSRSGFQSMHPSVTFVYYAGLLLFTALLFHPLFLFTELAGVLVLLLMQGEGRRLLSGLPFYLLIAGSVAVWNPLFSHRGSHILFYFLDQPVTLEAVLYGLMMMLVLLTIMFVFTSYNHNVSADKFMYLFGRLAPKSALLILMAIRFVPLFQRRLRQISIIQQTRGISISTGKLRQRMADGMTLLKVLLTWSLEEALQTADSMKARGYGVRKRSVYGIYTIDRQDVMALALMGVSGLAIVLFSLVGYGMMEIYPRLKTPVFHWEDWVMHGCLCLFLVIPIILEGKEMWLWRSYGQKDYPSATLMGEEIPSTIFRSL